MFSTLITQVFQQAHSLMGKLGFHVEIIKFELLVLRAMTWPRGPECYSIHNIIN